MDGNNSTGNNSILTPTVISNLEEADVSESNGNFGGRKNRRNKTNGGKRKGARRNKRRVTRRNKRKGTRRNKRN